MKHPELQLFLRQGAADGLLGLAPDNARNRAHVMTNHMAEPLRTRAFAFYLRGWAETIEHAPIYTALVIECWQVIGECAEYLANVNRIAGTTPPPRFHRFRPYSNTTPEYLLDADLEDLEDFELASDILAYAVADTVNNIHEHLEHREHLDITLQERADR